MSLVIRCDPCGKNFTGPVCYNQHLESEKHKRKILSASFLSNSNRADMQAPSTVAQIPQLPTFECPICEVVFNSLRDFQAHSLSPEHAQKVIEKNSERNFMCDIVSSSGSVLNFEASSTNRNIFDDENDKIFSENEMTRSQALSFATCSTCNKIFSGPEPYKQHMESLPHKRKVELEKNAADSKTNQNMAPYSCDPCKKIFSGQVPYIQHMKSEVHRKKLLTLELLEKGTSEIDSVTESKAVEIKLKENDQSNPWFCITCDKQCSGLIPYKQHLEGITHLKNTAKAQREKSNFNPGDSVQLPLQNRTEDKNILYASYPVNGDNVQLNGNGNMDVDYILPGMMDNLKVMSSEELEASIKIFLPDDPVDFDKPDNQINIDSEEKFCTSEGVQVYEIKENSDVYQVCNVCNINLISKEEAINHYESLDHFSKRWQKPLI